MSEKLNSWGTFTNARPATVSYPDLTATLKKANLNSEIAFSNKLQLP